MFITIEGTDGSGKSTQAHLLSERLRQDGHDVVQTREPGGTTGAELIRSLVTQGDVDRWSAETEILLFTAARRDHLERVIDPALARGQTVICDRFVDSTRIYQGCKHPDLRQLVDSLHELMIQREPDLTILVDVDPAAGLHRARTRESQETRFETLGKAAQTTMRSGFLALASEFPNRFITINGTRNINAVCDDVYSSVSRALTMRHISCGHSKPNVKR